MLNWWITFWTMIICSQPCLGQVTIYSGAGLPDAPLATMWFHDTLSLMMMHYADGTWTTLSDDAKWKVSVCNNLVVFRNEGPLYDDFLVSDSMGNFILANGREVYCGEKMLAFKGEDTWKLLDNGMKGAAFYNLTMPVLSDCGATNPDTIAGEVCFCAAAFSGYVLEKFNCNEMRNWGVINGKSQWLIEPKFDQPFRFQDGFAEVLYYGQKRKINEKGEFVE